MRELLQAVRAAAHAAAWLALLIAVIIIGTEKMT